MCEKKQRKVDSMIKVPEKNDHNSTYFWPLVVLYMIKVDTRNHNLRTSTRYSTHDLPKKVIERHIRQPFTNYLKTTM